MCHLQAVRTTYGWQRMGPAGSLFSTAIVTFFHQGPEPPVFDEQADGALRGMEDCSCFDDFPITTNPL
jgi:hypothetical protein